jgi:hypothetical protein
MNKRIGKWFCQCCRCERGLEGAQHIVKAVKIKQRVRTCSRMTAIAPYLKNGEKAAYGTLPGCLKEVEIMPI